MSTSRLIASGTAAAAAALAVGVTFRRETEGNKGNQARLGASASLSAAVAAGSSTMSSLRLLRSKAVGLFPVVYAKEAEGIAGSSDGHDPVPDDCPFCTLLEKGPCGTYVASFNMCVREAQGGGEDVCASAAELVMACVKKDPEYYGKMLLDMDDAQHD